jgi:glycosyltransferase involved in cell wall biosynthesis
VRALIVSQYFPPEPGATQNRLGSFVDGLIARGHSVTVVCEQPNHPGGVFHPGFGRYPMVTERRERLTIHRLWVAASPHKTATRRMAFYGTFAVGAAAAVALARPHDVVFASSPPLPGALAAAAGAAARGTSFVLDVRDLWPAAAEALGELSDARVIDAFERAEQWLYRRAYCVTATTRPFCAHIDRIAGREISVHLPNGALDELIALPDVDPPVDGPFTIGYAGNLGIAQGLSAVFDAAEQLRDADVRFLLIGDGPLTEALRAEGQARRLSAVQFLPPVPVNRIGALLQSCHALLVPLRAHPLLGDFIPSKLYDAMAVGRPAIVAAEGEAARLTEEVGCGLVVPPENGAALAAAVRRLAEDRDLTAALGKRGRSAAPTHARSRQIERLEEILIRASDRAHRR